MPVNPNLLERLVLLRLNRGPGPVLDLFGAASFEALCLALEMDVFETLAAGDLSTPVKWRSERQSVGASRTWARERLRTRR